MPLDFNWPFPKSQSRLWNFSSSVILKMGAIYSKTIMNVLNSCTVHNKSILDNVMVHTGKIPIITVSNHYSCMDDPALWGIIPWRILNHRCKIRWALGANDILFTNYWHTMLFTLGKVIPIVRGDGVYQKGMDYCLSKLNNNSWVHIFPEGKINLNKDYMRFKWGIGRLISECERIPLVLPIYHSGMDEILPNERPYIPRVGKHVTVIIGNPINVENMLKSLRSLQLSPMEIRKRITDYIQQEFFAFRRDAVQKYNLDG